MTLSLLLLLVFIQLSYCIQQHPLLFTKTRQQLRKERGGLLDSSELSLHEKQAYIKSAFVYSWEGYKKYSWGYDENKPVSKGARNTRNGWGATIVDALDTLYIMNLKEDFILARSYVGFIEWDSLIQDEPVQLFETVIRYVGGLLSAYDLSTETVFLDKVVELVDLLLPAFDTETGIPYQYINMTTGVPLKQTVACLAEIGTLQLELTRLSELTGNWTYHYKGQHVYDVFTRSKLKGLFPHLVDVHTGQPIGAYVTWGGMGDSFYEYLIKQSVISNGRDKRIKDMAVQSITSMQKHLVTSTLNDRSFLSNLNGGEKEHRMDELACFAPGSLLLMARQFPDEFDHLEKVAEQLMNGCYNAWDSTETGIAAEIFTWKRPSNEVNKDIYSIVPSYILRPETIESLYYFYVFTKDTKYQDMAWDIFNSLYTYCRSNSGYSGLVNVDSVDTEKDDREESFFFAETLKYLYLIFDDPHHPRFPLDEWVFNTEAHPLRITDIIPPPEKKTWLSYFY
ncbi:glycoside hydrolase [Pilobolus umbonatus]|nr:glycoside hydrolase [Pilobolus umbonatus]